jgi:hypothetical protein
LNASFHGLILGACGKIMDLDVFLFYGIYIFISRGKIRVFGVELKDFQ